MINFFIHLTTFKESHFLFIAVTCQLPRHKGKITWSHGQFCIFICAYLDKKIPLILPLIHLHSLASNETKWNERNEVAKQSNDFTNFSSVTFAWTAAALPAGWWTHMARVIDKKSFHFLLFDQFSWFDTLFIIEGLYILLLRNLLILLFD